MEVTEELLATLETLCEQATPRPWAMFKYSGGQPAVHASEPVPLDSPLAFDKGERRQQDRFQAGIRAPNGGVSDTELDADAALIVAAVNALPELLRLARLGLRAGESAAVNQERERCAAALLDEMCAFNDDGRSAYNGIQRARLTALAGHLRAGGKA